MMLRPGLIKSGMGVQVGDVFSVVLATGANLQAAIDALAFTPDLIIAKNRSSSAAWTWRDTVRGTTLQFVTPNSGFGESAFTAYSGSDNFVAYCFKRYAGFLDIDTRMGVAGANTRVTHGLGVAPALVFTKIRDGDGSLPSVAWAAYHVSMGRSYNLLLESAAPVSSADFWGTSNPTTSDMGIGFSSSVGRSGYQFADYLFAHSPTGLIQGITFATNGVGAGSFDTGWASTGAQFVMIRQSDGADAWSVFDTTRTAGFSGSDAQLVLDTSAAETTGSVAQSAGVLSFSGPSFTNYIGLAIKAP